MLLLLAIDRSWAEACHIEFLATEIEMEMI